MFPTTLLAETFFILLFGHFLADFALQNDFVARSKDPRFNVREMWIPVMIAHCMIHAGVVFIITGYLSLALFQFATHYLIDVAKCMQMFGKTDRAFVIDQMLHVAVMAIIALAFTYM